eukprot:s2527_g14.t1
MAVPPLDDAQRRTWLQSNVDADLLYVLDQMGVALERQHDLCQHYKSIALFAAIADTRAEARTALARDLQIDVAANAAARASLAAVVAAWQQAADAAEKERGMKAEARALGLPKPLLQTEKHAMRAAVERQLGRLDEREEPSGDYLSMKMEETEAGELLASSLDEISSIKDDVSSQLQSSLDPSGRLRITKEKKRARMPTNSEELRTKLKLECHALLMLAARFKNKIWFQELSTTTFQRYVDFLLGDKIYQLQISKGDGSSQTTMANPSWDLMLSYEHRLRKEAYKRASRDGITINDALAAVVADSSLKETYFVTPLTLEFARRTTASSSTSSPAAGSYDKWRPSTKGDSNKRPGPKGGGKGKSRKGKLGAKSNAGFVYSTTPDGRQICYAYNNATCNGQCFTWETWHQENAAAPVFHVLYLFAGAHRKADVGGYMATWAKDNKVTLKGLQIDILRDATHDLLQQQAWSWVVAQLRAGVVSLLIAAPPCNTYSRARCQYRSRGGPRPLRDFQFSRGFPWLKEADRATVAKANELVDKSFEACALALQAGGDFLLEHPEQLGRTQGQVPASIWDSNETAELLCDKKVRTFAFFQCQFGAPSSKPTRFLTTLGDSKSGYFGLHQLDEDGKYLGPLPAHCPHGPSSHEALVGKSADGAWKTAPSAAYPAQMCAWIASMAGSALLRCRGGQGQPTAEPASLQASSGPSTAEEDPFHGVLKGALLEHKGMPMTCNWHAKVPTSFNDGCGLCSPGRWPPARRNFQGGERGEFIDRLAALIKNFTREVIKDTQRMFFALSLGKLERAPFTEEQMERLRRAWFAMLPSPEEAEKIPEGQPFFLHALAQTARKMGEEDSDVLDSGEDNYCDGRMVGYKYTFPRVPLVFRPKLKERQYDESEYRLENDNYGSAKDHKQQIETQFAEEEKLGFMFPLTEAEARRRYGDRLRVAALGAIPKDDGRVRVIFDATHFVQVNNHIGILDRLEFPGPEASATAMETTLDSGFRLMVAVAADTALAHRRFKHRAEDVGLL